MKKIVMIENSVVAYRQIVMIEKDCTIKKDCNDWKFSSIQADCDDRKFSSNIQADCYNRKGL